MGNLTHTVSGDIVSFRSAARVPIESLKCHFMPKQDLHGYDRSWPGGGGKNQLNIEAVEYGTFDQETGLPITSSYPSQVRTTYDIAVTAGDSWILSNNISHNCRCFFWDINGDYVGNVLAIVNTAFTIPTNAIKMRVVSGADRFLASENQQLEKGSTATAYEPYENICPIEGWNQITSSRITGDYNINYFPGTTVSYNVTFNVNENGFVTAEGTPTSYSTCYYGTIDVDGNETLYGTIFGTLNNITWNKPSLYDSNNNAITNSLPDNALSLGLDLSQFQDVKKVRIALKRGANNVFMNGYCSVVIGKNRKIQPTTLPVTFPVLGKNKFNWNVEQGHASPITSDYQTARTYPLNTYIIGLSSSNYYRDNYINWVLEPSITNGTISFSSGNASGYGIGFPLDLIVGQTYFLSGTVTNGGFAAALYYDNDGKLISSQTNRLNKTITIPMNTKTTIIVFYASSTQTSYSFSNIQLELGTEVTEYEPYNPNNTVYGGYVDIAKGELVQTHYNMIIDNNTAISSSEDKHGVFRIVYVLPKIGANKNFLACNIFGRRSRNTAMSNYPTKGLAALGPYNDNTTNLQIGAPNEITTQQDWIDWITLNGPIQVIYELAEPIHYPLSKTQLQTFLDQNNIWSNTNGNTEVSYAIHDSNMIQSARKAIAGNEPHIETASGTIANFNTDMTVPLKEAKIYFEPVQDLHNYDSVWLGGYGKNLFNINVLEQNPDDITASNTTVRNITPGTYFVGASWSNWLQANQIIEFSISNETLSIKNNNVYGIGFAFKLAAETTYAISATTTKGGIHAAFYDIDGNYISGTSTSILNSTFTTPTNANITVLVFFNRTQGADAEPATFSNIQLEKGSSVTSYVPYENMCPIEGWDNIEVYKTGKSLFQFKRDNFPITVDYYNGNASWFDNTDITKIPQVPITYSVYLDMTDATSQYDSNTQTWIWTKRNNYRFSTGNPISSGTSGRSISNMTLNSNDEWAAFGLSIRKDGIASNPMIEIGNEATEYEPYNGITIPFMFSTTKNLFNEKFTGITSTLTYHSYYVGNDIITASTTTPKSTEGWSNIFVLSGIMTSGANTTVNDICEGQTRTITPTNGYITIAYRNGYNIDPRNYQTQIEKGLTATSYESYKPIYGGYIDLVTGEIYSKYHKLNLANLSWYNYSGHQSHYTTINRPANGLIFSNILTPKVNTIWPGQGGIGYYTQDKYRKNIYVQKQEAAVSDVEFRTWFAEMHPNAYIVYELAVPELVTTLSPTQLKALRGQNNIWSNANGPIEVKYWTH